jgi:hypothetical protein
LCGQFASFNGNIPAAHRGGVAFYFGFHKLSPFPAFRD